MDIFFKEYEVGNIRIELSVQEEDGCRVFCTAKDLDNVILWKTPLTDSEGKIIVYPTVEDAFIDAKTRLKLNS